jgi:hypothetical protein
MPKQKDTFSTTYEERTEGETLLFTVTVMASMQGFQFAHSLEERGVIPSIESRLKQSTREAVVAYLESAEDLIAGIGAGQKKAANGTKAKAKDAPVLGSNGPTNGLMNGAMSRVTNGAMKVGESGAGNGAESGHLGAVVSSVEANGLASEMSGDLPGDLENVLALQ